MTNETENKPRIDQWDDFAGEYIKAEIIKEFPAVVVVTDIKSEYIDDKPKLIAEIELNEKSWKFDLNKTNQTVIKKFCKAPKDLIGKKLTLIKIKQRNPSTNSMVDSLLIDNIE